jgi:hypothetical protein
MSEPSAGVETFETLQRIADHRDYYNATDHRLLLMVEPLGGTGGVQEIEIPLKRIGSAEAFHDRTARITVHYGDCTRQINAEADHRGAEHGVDAFAGDEQGHEEPSVVIHDATIEEVATDG